MIAAAGLFLCRQIGVRITHVLLARDSWDYIEQLMYLSVLYLAGLIVGFSLLRRYKARILWSSSLLKRAMEALQIFHLKQTLLRTDHRSVCDILRSKPAHYRRELLSVFQLAVRQPGAPG